MSSKKKKILSALLASSMIMSQVCVVAYADTYELTIPASESIENATVTVKKVVDDVPGEAITTGAQLNTGDELEITISNVPAGKKPVIKVNDNALTESDGKYSYIVQEAAVVISVEYLNEYTVTGGSYIVLKKGGAAVDSGTKFVKDDVLTIEPAAGYKFSAAPTVGGSAATSNDEGATYTYKFFGTENTDTPGELTIVDNTAKKTCKLSFDGVTVSGSEVGEVTSGTTDVPYGETITITAGAKADDKQVAVTVGGADAAAAEDESNYKFTYTIPDSITDGDTLAIVAAVSYKVTFSSDVESVTVDESPISSGDFVANGKTLTITAKSVTGKTAAIKANTQTLVGTTTDVNSAAVDITVEYTPIDISLVTTSAQSDKVDITVTRGESPLGELPEKVQVGDKITFAPKSESNVVIKSVSVNGTSLAKIEDGYTVKGDEENVTIVVEVQNAYKINVANKPENVVLKKDEDDVTADTVFVNGDTLTIKPATGYHFADTPNVTVGEISATKGDGVYTYTFDGTENESAGGTLDVTASVEQDAEPSPATYAVTFGEGLTVKYGSEQSVTSGDELEDGTALTITAAEKKGYTAKIKVNGADNAGSFTINGAAVEITVEYVAKDIALTPSGEGKDNVTITVTRGEGEGAQTISDLNKLNVGDVITFAPKTGYSITKITVGEAQDDVKEGYTVVGDDEGGITLNITTAKVFTVGDAPANTKLYKGENEVTSTTTFAVDETLTIKPETGYKFTAAPTVGGKAATAGENGEYTYTFTDSDTSTSALTVSATAKKVSKIASIPEGFTVQNSNKETLNKDSEVLEGDELTITPNVTAPDKLNRVVINGTAYGAKENYSFTVGTADVEIKAEVAKVKTFEVLGFKDEYFDSEQLTLENVKTGLELTVTYDDGSVEYHVPIANANLGSWSKTTEQFSFQIIYGGLVMPVSKPITAVAVEKIAVTSDLTKREYKVGEELSLEGGKITVYNNDGTSTVVDMSDASVSVTGYDTETEPNSDLKLTITYTNNGVNYTTEYSIVVVAADAKEVSSILISTQPTKTAYFVGDELSVDGKITVSYSDGSSSEIAITPAMVTDFNSSAAAAKQTLTVTYGGQTATYDISVTAVAVSSIAVTAPTKKDYKVGESLDLTGGSLVATYNNGKEETLPLTAAGVSVTGFNSAAPAQNQEITVSYGGQNGTFNVNIAEKSYKVNFSNATVKNGETELKTGDSVAENTVLTVTAAPKDGYTAALKVNGTAQSGTSATITVINDVTITVEYTKKSSGGSSGGSGGSSSGGSSSTTKNPTVDGKTQTWTNVANDIAKLPEGKTQTIDLNGGTNVPVDVVKAIATSNAEVTLKVDEVFSWTIDGSDIEAKDAKAANLSITKTTVTGTSALRGIVGTGFSIKGTNVKSELNINFKATHAGEFANLFKKVDGKLVFVDNVKVDKNGAAIGLEVSEKGEYVVMLGKYSDRAGDMDNDGISNAKDSLAILKDFLDMEKGVNPLVADVNGDGFINAKDALQVLIEYLGIK